MNWALTVVLNGGTICNFGRGLIMVVTLWELSLATQPSGVHCIWLDGIWPPRAFPENPNPGWGRPRCFLAGGPYEIENLLNSCFVIWRKNVLKSLFQSMTAQIYSRDCKAVQLLVERLVEGRNFRRTIVWRKDLRSLDEVGKVVFFSWRDHLVLVKSKGENICIVFSKFQAPSVGQVFLAKDLFIKIRTRTVVKLLLLWFDFLWILKSLYQLSNIST